MTITMEPAPEVSCLREAVIQPLQVSYQVKTGKDRVSIRSSLRIPQEPSQLIKAFFWLPTTATPKWLRAL